ncbi:MAG: SRPBCC domain-containing protein [Actinobacteria bacterium]|nr:SRPBCC domain-containing protein [Actinomycetota bacterium]
MAGTTTGTAVTTQVYRIYIKAWPQAIWDAITEPEWNAKYGYPGAGEYDLRPGGKYLARADEQAQAMGMPAELVDGEILAADPPWKLVQTWRALWDPELVAEGPTRVTWEISEEEGGISRLTVTHELEGAPLHAAQVASTLPLAEGGGGWIWILSDLKTLLETGKASG